jgi:hypothetical protein
MPDDTGEYMLGDITVSLVLMESTSSLSPGDANTENWTAGSIAAVKAKVEEGVNWWKQTLVNEFPSVDPAILNFNFDYTYADNPVQTGFEPISRKSDDNIYWVSSFLSQTGLTQTGNISTDIRAFNNSQRLKNHSSWAFTIFAVNDTNDADHAFASNGRFSYGFAYAGGRYIVIPASRPTSSFTHEVGHMFWALDEYSGGGSYNDRRGYYNTQNSNSATNPTVGFVQQPSIMANGTSLSTAYNTNTTADPALAMIGWKDSDSDGIFDVLDVPFSLEGSGWFDEGDGTSKFLGKSSVRTLGNKNPEGLGNDITLNVIREAQYAIDGGGWQTAGTYDAYQTDLALAFPIPANAQQVRIRTVDTITKAASPEYISDRPLNPDIISSSGIAGFVWNDSDYDGIFDPDELPMVDTPVQLVDAQGHDLVLHKTLSPDSYSELTALDYVHPEVTLSANVYLTGAAAVTGEVVAKTSTSAPYAERVFGAPSDADPNFVFDTWNLDARAFRADFSSPVSTVSLRAWGSGSGTVGRLAAYNSAGQLVGRYTTQFLSSVQSEMMTINRSEGDISYILAGGDFNRYVVLEDLEWGPNSRTTTNAQGAYWLPNLPSGTYYAKTPLSQFQITSTPVGGPATVTVDSSGAQKASFGVIQLPNPWHNSAVGRNCDVNNNGSIEIDDILASVYFFNQYPSQNLPTTAPGYAAFVDADNDGAMTIKDLLCVIAEYNSGLLNGEPNSSTSVTSSGSGTSGINGLGGNTGPNGETPAEYFVDVPSDHLEHVHTDEEHGDHDDHDHGHDEHDHETIAGLVINTSSAAGESNYAAAVLLGLLNEVDQSSPSNPATQSQAATTQNVSLDQDEALLSLLDEPLI